MAPRNNAFPLVESSQHPTHSKQLPLELIDYIIVSLDDCKKDKREYQRSILPALKACSLVCRAWNDISRSRIFRTFKIALCMATDNIEILPKLSFLHFTASYLCKYIIKLTIMWGDDIQDTPTWISDALQRFVNLRSLIITDLSADGSSPPAPSASAIMSLVAKAPLRKLGLRCWNLSADASNLLHILALCSSTLEELSLNMCYIRSPETLPKPVNSELPPVVRLRVLRKIKLSQVDIPTSQFNQVDVPNLDFLSCAHNRYPFPEIQWIPASLSTVALIGIYHPRLLSFILPSNLHPFKSCKIPTSPASTDSSAPLA